MPSIRRFCFHLWLTALLAVAPVGAGLPLLPPAQLELPAELAQASGLALAAPDRAPFVRPGEHVVRGVKIVGSVPPSRNAGPVEMPGRSRERWPQWELREGRIVFPGLQPERSWAVLVRTRVMGVPITGYEVRARMDGGRLVSPVPLPTVFTGAVEAFAVDLTASVEGIVAPILMEDPLDGDPLGERSPLVFVPGKSNVSDHDADHYEEGKILVWREIRRHPSYAKLRRAYKPYIYMYPTYRSFGQNGADLVRLVRERIGELGQRKVALVCQSLGGPVARHAMMHEGFGASVSRIITVSSPHHGALGASLRYANDRIGERLGPVFTLVLRLGQSFEPDTPCLRDLTWDGYDGGVTKADQERYGVVLNHAAAAFNEAWPYADRLVCLASDVDTLLGHASALGVPAEVFRRGEAAWLPRYGNADPIVPFGSALYEGRDVLDRMAIRNVDHEGLIFHPRVVAAIYRHLTAAALQP